MTRSQSPGGSLIFAHAKRGKSTINVAACPTAVFGGTTSNLNMVSSAQLGLPKVSVIPITTLSKVADLVEGFSNPSKFPGPRS